MIKIQMSGRLGNQLFQWAYAHQLVQEFNTKVVLTYDSRNYQNLIDVIPKPDCCSDIKTVRDEGLGLAIKIIDKVQISENIFVKKWLFSQSNPYILPNFEKAPKVVRGYFTTGNVIDSIQQHLCSSLNNWVDNAVPFSQENLNIQSELSNYQVMHIRRGDFLNYKDSLGTLGVGYYQKHRNWDLPLVLVTDAENELPEFSTILRPSAVFHSRNSTIYDSINWVRNANSAILSNSTFAWWAGLLCWSNGGEVSLPNPFYKKDLLVNDSFGIPEFKRISSEFD